MELKLTPVEVGLLRELLKNTIPEVETQAEFSDNPRALKNKSYYLAKVSGYKSILNKLK